MQEVFYQRSQSEGEAEPVTGSVAFLRMVPECKRYYRISLPHDIEVRRLFAQKKRLAVRLYDCGCRHGQLCCDGEPISLTSTTGKLFRGGRSCRPGGSGGYCQALLSKYCCG